MSVENLTEITDQLTRREKKRRNPVPWIILLLLTVLIFIFVLIPKLKLYASLRDDLKSLELVVPQLEAEKNRFQSMNNELKIEFDRESKPYLIRESQILPKVIDVAKVARILEIYSLQVDLLSASSVNARFDLEKVDFGKRTRMKKRPYTYNDATINLVADMNSLKEFILFLQTGDLPSRLKEAKNSNVLNPTDYRFMEDNLLPMTNIESISLIEDSKSEVEGILKVNLKVRFFSQLVS